MEYIAIDVEEVPYKFEIDLAGDIFGFEIHYNYDYDFFTVDLSVGDEVVVYGEKVMYGKPLFSSLADSRLPKVNIVPRDLNGTETRVGWDQLGKTVFLMVEPVGV